MSDLEYPLYEWEESQMLAHCQLIINGAHHSIHKIRLNKTDEVYLVPKEFYLAAKESFKSNKDTGNNKEILTTTKEEKK